MDTILVVDDDRKVRESIRDVLADEGFRVDLAADGREALERIAANAPQLVLLDVWMPELDGIEVLTLIRDVAAEVPVIVLSGHGSVEVAVKATRLGAVDFIEKPFSIDGLLAAVRRALRRGSADVSAPQDERASARRPASQDAPTRCQRTLARGVVAGGHGLHSGVRTGLVLHPAPRDSGIRFAKVGGDLTIEAVVDNVESTGYATSLAADGVVARTVEHLMAALHAYGLTNLLIKVESEVPILDGSAAELCALIDSAGVIEQEGTVPIYRVAEPVSIEDGQAWIAARPYDGLRITYELSYPPPIGEQVYTFELDAPDAFRSQIAPARTFGFVEEIRALEAAGLGQGGQLGNFILIGETGIVNTELRFPEELARHKILDLIGDLYLLGVPVWGEIHARKTGHRHNIALVRELRRRLLAEAD